MIEARDGARVAVDGRELINFCSNDYLGPVAAPGRGQRVPGGQRHARRRQRRLGAGLRPPRASTPRSSAKPPSGWAIQRALCFGSGYLANLAVLQSLLGPGDVCVQDKLNHACLLDGARLALCELKRYPHRDSEAAMRQLMSERKGAAMLATDGVFSMDGDLAPLRDLAMLSRSQDALLYVDDAHGIGVIGPEGRGSVARRQPRRTPKCRCWCCRWARPSAARARCCSAATR